MEHQTPIHKFHTILSSRLIVAANKIKIQKFQGVGNNAEPGRSVAKPVIIGNRKRMSARCPSGSRS